MISRAVPTTVVIAVMAMNPKRATMELMNLQEHQSRYVTTTVTNPSAGECSHFLVRFTSNYTCDVALTKVILFMWDSTKRSLSIFKVPVWAPLCHDSEATVSPGAFRTKNHSPGWHASDPVCVLVPHNPLRTTRCSLGGP